MRSGGLTEGRQGRSREDNERGDNGVRAQLQRAVNQVHVDVKTAVIGLQQARARYETAVATRVLAEQSLRAEQRLFQSGLSSVALVIQAQKDLATDTARSP